MSGAALSAGSGGHLCRLRPAADQQVASAGKAEARWNAYSPEVQS